MPDPFFTNIPEHIKCLGKMFEHPRRSCQRLVEQMTFLPNGGRHWRRTIQIQLPSDTLPNSRAWHVVSLGVFRRRRLPDLTVSDAAGARINLVTRDQHGALLVGYVLTKHFKDFPSQTAALEAASGTHEHGMYSKLLAILYDTVTTVGDVDEPQRELRKPAAIYEYLLRSFNPVPEDTTDRVAAFRNNFEELLNFTHYLCWVQGEPGEVINVQTCHTTTDSGQRPEWNEEDKDSARIEDSSGQRLERRTRWLRAFGLAPLNCQCSTPSNGFTGSYYFTLEPPPKTEVTFLDWSIGNNFEDDKKERDSALDSVHFHYRHDSRPNPFERGRAVRAYMRCSTNGHKQIAAGGALNLVFVILVATGKLSDVVGGSAQTWLLVTPTILTAYIADQQRHYYAYATRRQRAILWIYLTISVAFLVTTSFRLAEGSSNNDHWNWLGTITAWMLLVSSAAVCTWYALLGYSFRWITTRWAERELKATRASRARLSAALEQHQLPAETRRRVLVMLPSAWRIYERVVYNYCKIILSLVVVVSLVTVLGIRLWWSPSSKSKPKSESSVACIWHGSGTLTLATQFLENCKNVNINLRFAPSPTE